MRTNTLSGIRALGLLCIGVLLLAGCATRSISNSGYHADPDRGYAQRNSPFYKGELSEFDVLGIDPKTPIAESEIQKSLAARTRISIGKGSPLMLVQSGAMIPDEDMVRGLERYYTVSVFTGVPAGGGAPGDAYAKALRLAAATAGYDALMVYWGLLETGREDLATKIVSWIPFIGGAIPDESQRMRIRMKVAIVDVKSGRWDMFLPPPFEDTDASGRFTRISSDQAQVALLKAKAYNAAVDDVVRRFSR